MKFRLLNYPTESGDRYRIMDGTEVEEIYKILRDLFVLCIVVPAPQTHAKLHTLSNLSSEER